MAGLSISGLLTKRGYKVRVVEADSLKSETRPHAFQRRYFHIVSAGGLRMYCDLFPGLEAKMDAVGAPRAHWTTDSSKNVEVRAIYPSGELWLGDMGFETRNITRECFERLIREEAVELGVEFIDEQPVNRLLYSDDLLEVIGVETKSDQQYFADIVIDARGRNSRLRQELSHGGYTLPAEIIVDPHLVYASVHITGVEMSELVLGVTESKDHPYGAGIQKTEDGYVAILFSMGESESKPVVRQIRNLEDFKLAASTISPILTTALANAELIPGEWVLVASGKGLYNRRIPFEKVERFPARLYALGDVIQSHNPRYGQGQAAAIQQAMVLDDAIEHGLDQLGFYNLAQSLLTFLWQLPTGADFRFATTTTNGPLPNLMDKVQATMFARLEGLMSKDKRVAITLMRVLQDLADSSEMAKPWILFKILGSFFR